MAFRINPAPSCPAAYAMGTPGSLERGGYTNTRWMLSDLMRDMRALGFTLLGTNNLENLASVTDGPDSTDYADNDYAWAVFESNGFVDPLSGDEQENPQKYRICLKASTSDYGVSNVSRTRYADNPNFITDYPPLTNKYKPDGFHDAGYAYEPYRGQNYMGTLFLEGGPPPIGHNSDRIISDIVSDTMFRIQVASDSVIQPSWDSLGKFGVLNDTRTVFGSAVFGVTHHLGDLSFSPNILSPNYAFFSLNNWFAIDDGSYMGSACNTYSSDDNNKYLNIPLSYRLTVSDHGFTLFVWGGTVNAFRQVPQSWCVVQRPVNPTNGKPSITAKSPLFCVFGHNYKDYETSIATDQLVPLSPISDPTIYKRNVYAFIVREVDTLAPSVYRPADIFTQNGVPVINSQRQVSITENNQYVITIPNGITSDRYCYMDELDMIAYTSADILAQYASVDFSMYDENNVFGEIEGVRRYMAMHSNAPNNTGMRILVNVTGPGITVDRDFTSY